MRTAADSCAEDRLPKLVATIQQQFAESAKLEKEIARNFKVMGWE